MSPHKHTVHMQHQARLLGWVRYVLHSTATVIQAGILAAAALGEVQVPCSLALAATYIQPAALAETAAAARSMGTAPALRQQQQCGQALWREHIAIQLSSTAPVGLAATDRLEVHCALHWMCGSTSSQLPHRLGGSCRARCSRPAGCVLVLMWAQTLLGSTCKLTSMCCRGLRSCCSGGASNAITPGLLLFPRSSSSGSGVAAALPHCPVAVRVACCGHLVPQLGWVLQRTRTQQPQEQE